MYDLLVRAHTTETVYGVLENISSGCEFEGAEIAFVDAVVTFSKSFSDASIYFTSIIHLVRAPVSVIIVRGPLIAG